MEKKKRLLMTFKNTGKIIKIIPVHILQPVVSCLCIYVTVFPIACHVSVHNFLDYAQTLTGYPQFYPHFEQNVDKLSLFS